MEKLRKSLQPVYDEFVQTYIPAKDTKDNIRVLAYDEFKYVYIKKKKYLRIYLRENKLCTP